VKFLETDYFLLQYFINVRRAEMFHSIQYTNFFPETLSGTSTSTSEVSAESGPFLLPKGKQDL